MQESSRYTIREEIACGSTATVYLAEDGVLKRKVALKKLHPHLLNHPETVKRFEKEAVAVASLSHENIIRVFDFGYQDRNQFLAMEYVDGSSLESLLVASGGPLPNRVCLSVLSQLLSGLIAAHEAGIVHRDIKPANLLVDRKGRVRIADFGIAFLSEEMHITKTGSYLGTPVYSAPEQARGFPASEKSDIFSSGILLYRCATGRLPFEGETSHAIMAAILGQAPVKPVFRNRRLLPGFSELIEKMLAKDPDRRPTAATCLAELAAVARRNAIPLEGDFLRRFQENPAGYADAEERELADHFREQARMAEAGGNLRMYEKLTAQADLHLPPRASAPDADSRGTGAPSAARRGAALSLAGLLACIALAFLFGLSGTGRRDGESGPAPAAATPMPLPIPGVPEPLAIEPPADPPISPPAPAVRAIKTGAIASPESPRGGAEAAAKPSPAVIPEPVTPGSGLAASPETAVSAQASASSGEPAPGPAGILVKTDPPFAQVTVDGRPAGTTPFRTALELPEGDHDLLIEREGCLPLVRKVRLVPGETVVLRLVLDKAQAAAR